MCVCVRSRVEEAGVALGGGEGDLVQNLMHTHIPLLYINTHMCVCMYACNLVWFFLLHSPVLGFSK